MNMTRTVPKEAIDYDAGDFVYSNTRDVAAGTTGIVIPMEFYTGEKEFRRSKYWLDNAPSVHHMTRDVPGFMFLKPYKSPRITDLPSFPGIAEDDVEMTKVEEKYVPTGMYPRQVTSVSKRLTTWYADPNFLWDNPFIWHDTYLPTTMRWKSCWTEFPRGGVDLVCINPKKNRWEWERHATAIPFKSASTTVVRKSNENNYIVSVYADIEINGKTYPAGRYIKLTSKDPIIIKALNPTIIVHAWKKDAA